MKDSVAWLTEKASRLKLAHDGTGLALDFLVLGIHGKPHCGLALSEVAGRYARFQGADFAALKTRAEEQRQASCNEHTRSRRIRIDLPACAEFPYPLRFPL